MQVIEVDGMWSVWEQGRRHGPWFDHEEQAQNYMAALERSAELDERARRMFEVGSE